MLDHRLLSLLEYFIGSASTLEKGPALLWKGVLAGLDKTHLDQTLAGDSSADSRDEGANGPVVAPQKSTGSLDCSYSCWLYA